MNITTFFKLVEIRTKVASVIPYLLGTLYTLCAFDTFKPINAILMFLSMFIFDMTTTAINNYIDYTKAIKKDGYGYEVHNTIHKYGLKTQHVRFLIYTMLLISSILGILLALRTNIIVLLLGMICFAIGILYTFGPLPISRTPFGEIFSGFTMGLILTFITIYIHIFDQNVFTFSLAHEMLTVNLNLSVLLGIFMICIPLITCIANIMLANNICDMEEDLPNKRYTLPIYIGRKNALLLWETLYYLAYVAIIVGVVVRVLPWVSLLTLITLVPIMKNIKAFKAKQVKRETFICAIKNFVLLNVVYIMTLLLALLFK